MTDSQARVFITCGAGFVLSHLVATLLRVDTGTRLTLLLLAEDQIEADAYLENLFTVGRIPGGERGRVRAIPGDLRAPGLGIKDPSAIDSNYWINGTLPFKFGPTRKRSVEMAQLTICNLLDLLDYYDKNIEGIDHYLQVSSIRVGGQSSVPLAESLDYDYLPFDNFDCCKRAVEDAIRNWAKGRLQPPNTSVVRIGSLLSEDVTRIGGAVLLLSKELLGFGRHGRLPNVLPGDPNGVIRVAPALETAKAIARLIRLPPLWGIRVVNLSDNYDKLTVQEFVELINGCRAEYGEGHEKLTTNPDCRIVEPRDQEYCAWLYQTFGLFMLKKCTWADPEIAVAESILGSPWTSSDRFHRRSASLVQRTLAAAVRVGFVAAAPDLGPAPIY